MPRHRSLNLKKFIDSIPELLIEEYFKQKLGGGVPLLPRLVARQSRKNRSADFIFSVLSWTRLPLPRN
ncbi:hypothetical protein CWRG_00200 [Chthonomonas calidirosea]|nr:hypothetical protein CWRG_00200 [Chthonomonas calidirosea]